MGIDKRGSKGGNYVGGFLQMFDWNAKSRKKLFSSKSDVPEQSKQKKRCDGNLPTTRLQTLDVDEITAGSSIKESSDYSCSSSVIDEDYCVTKAPSVVARLMGLDSLPKSTPLFDSQSLNDVSFYQPSRNLEYFQDQQINYSTTLEDVPARNFMQPKYHKAINRPIEKFQTEILPPKSAKSIPFTHHKLLSPIKRADFIPTKDAAHIMEAAARIIEPGPQASVKTRMPPVGSSSVTLRVGGSKEKVQLAQKTSKVFEGSQRKAESSAAKSLKGQSMNKSWNGSVDSDEYSVCPKNKGKSISLALQAKANVLKREGLNVNNSSRSSVSQKESCELSPSPVFKSQSTNHKKASSKQNGSSVLRPNNQKQNSFVDRGKSPTKSNTKVGKTLNKPAGTAKVSSRMFGLEVKDDKSKMPSSSEKITRKKRSADGNYHSEKNQSFNDGQKEKNVKAVQSSNAVNMDWDRDSGITGTDVISFTFTAPMTRSGPTSLGPGGNCKIFSAGSQSNRSLVSSDGMSGSRFSYLGHNMKGGDALSALLEQKLKELAQKVEFYDQKSEMSSTVLEGNKATDGMDIDNQGVLEEMSMSGSNISQSKMSTDCRLPSPVSVLEHSPFADSCNSSDIADSYSTGGNKQFSSVQAHEFLDSYSSKMFLTIERDTELSDSASSNFVAKRRETTLTLTNCRKSTKWELEYMKEILRDIEPMFEDYAMGRTQGVIKVQLFGQLESRKGYLSNFGNISRIDRRLMFDCVSECLDLRCKQYVSGGFKIWAKGKSVITRKEKLAEEVYKEISGWSAVGDSMIDELVDKDMSGQYGKWLDFDIEAFDLGIQIESRILNSLIDEVVADILVL